MLPGTVKLFSLLLMARGLATFKEDCHWKFSVLKLVAHRMSNKSTKTGINSFLKRCFWDLSCKEKYLAQLSSIQNKC